MKTLLRYPGSKWNLANKIVDLLPKHKSYLEPYFGSGAVLFTKLPSAIETVNDLNEDIVNLFEIVRDNPDKLTNQTSVCILTRLTFSAQGLANSTATK